MRVSDAHAGIYYALLSEQIRLPDSKLDEAVKKWEKRSAFWRFLSTINPLDDSEARCDAAKEILASRASPESTAAFIAERRLGATWSGPPAGPLLRLFNDS